MEQYIRKSDIIAEIEKRKQELHPTDTHKMQVGEKIDRDVLMWLNALTWVKKVIDTLEVKEVDLEKEFFDWYHEEKNRDYNASVLYERYGIISKKLAKHFYELGMQKSKNDSSNEEKR